MSDVKLCIAGKNDIAVNVLLYIINNNIYNKSEINIICNKNESGENNWQKSLRYFANRLNIKEINLEEAYLLPNVIFLSLEFDKIVKPDLFKTKYLYNIHFSLLPKYKGMYTSVMPLLNQEKETGVTFHKIDKGIDTGEIVDQIAFQISDTDNAQDIYYKYLRSGTEMVIKEILQMKKYGGELVSRKQKNKNSTYYSVNTIDFNNIIINMNQTADNILHQLRAYTFRAYQMPTVYNKKIAYGEVLQTPSSGAKPGSLLWADSDRMLLATIDYNIVLYVDRFSDVMEYSRKGNINAIKKVPKLYIYMNQKDDDGWTPLIAATYFGYTDMSMMMISLGADIEQTDNNGKNLLMYAKAGWEKTGDNSLLCYFHEHGIDMEARDYTGTNLCEYCKQGNIDIKNLVSCKMKLNK